MKLMDLILVGGIALLLRSRLASATSTIPPQSPINLEVISPAEKQTWIATNKPPYSLGALSYTDQQVAKTAMYPDFSAFIKHIQDTVVAAGFSKPYINVPWNMKYDNKIKSQLVMPVFDARVALQNRMKAYWGSGYHAPAEMQTALDAAMKFERSLNAEITEYYKTGKWS